MNNLPAIDWDGIGREMAEVMRKLLIDERWIGTDPDRYAEALRRTLGYTAANPDDRHSCDHISTRFGLTTEADFRRHIAEGDAASDVRAEAAERQVAEMRAEVKRVYAEARQEIADRLRVLAARQSSKYRREGVEWAADQLAPRIAEAGQP